MIEVRCCCTPENLIGHVPYEAGVNAHLELRELDDGSHAFSSEERQDIETIPGFRPARKPGGRRTWRKGK